ncbi:MAG: hypothetical protein Q8L47_04860 [bacterium]|nr:hypothetical protein [bacterium]
MNTLLRQILSIILIVFLFWVMFYGSFLPLVKSQQFIKARQTQVNTLVDFDKLYGGVLGFPSPVGQDEITSNYLEMIGNIIGQEKGKTQPNEAIIRPLVASSTMWAEPIIKRGAAFSFSQIIFNYANVYRDAAIALKDKAYYEKAVELYRFGLKQSPDRQIFLYSLFDLYNMTGDKENARIIGDRIVKVYKDDRVIEILKSINQ